MLRHGDRAQRPAGGDQQWTHPNTYTIPGLIRSGFANVGMHVRSIQGEATVTCSRRLLESLCTVASVAQALMQQGAAKLRSQLDGFKSLVLNRFYDSTPMFLRFGRFESKLSTQARYLKPVEPVAGGYVRWKTIPYEEYKKLHPNSAPQMGVLEVNASSSLLAYASWDDEQEGEQWESTLQQHTQEVIFPPALLQRGTSSCIYGAAETSSPSFSIAELKKWAAASPDHVAILNDCPDNSKPNGRAKKAMAAALPEDNILVESYAGCVVHKLHGFLTKVIGEDKLVGHVHACQVVLNIEQRRSTLQGAFFASTRPRA